MRDWLSQTKRIQQDVYGVDVEGATTSDKTAYIKDMALAIFAEAGEVLREFSWKSWAQDEPFINRRELVEECVDVLMFVANILVAVGVTDDEIEQVYHDKTVTNILRQINGYTVREKDAVR